MCYEFLHGQSFQDVVNLSSSSNWYIAWLVLAFTHFWNRFVWVFHCCNLVFPFVLFHSSCIFSSSGCHSPNFECRTISLEVPRKKSPATPRTRQLKTPGAETDCVSPNPASRTPKDRSPKVTERKSPRSPATEVLSYN